MGRGTALTPPTPWQWTVNDDVIVTGGSETGPWTYLYDCVTIKYSSAGVPLWTNRFDGLGNGDDYARAIALDSERQRDRGGVSEGSTSSRDYLTIKYSSAGVPLWTNRYNGPGNSLDDANAVAVDGNNNVIVTGIPLAAEAVAITRPSSIRVQACRSGPTATTGR